MPHSVVALICSKLKQSRIKTCLTKSNMSMTMFDNVSCLTKSDEVNTIAISTKSATN